MDSNQTLNDKDIKNKSYDAEKKLMLIIKLLITFLIIATSGFLWFQNGFSIIIFLAYLAVGFYLIYRLIVFAQTWLLKITKNSRLKSLITYIVHYDNRTGGNYVVGDGIQISGGLNSANEINIQNHPSLHRTSMSDVDKTEPHQAPKKDVPVVDAEPNATQMDDDIQWRLWFRVMRRMVYHPLSILLILLVGFTVTTMVAKSFQPKIFVIDKWENRTPGASKYELKLTDDTRRILYQKLALVDDLQGVQWDMPLVASENDFDYWITGDFRKIDEIELTADVHTAKGFHLGSPNVKRQIDDTTPEAEICILDLQQELALEILQALDITVTETVSEAMRHEPTASCDALLANNEGVVLAIEGKYSQSKLKLEQAIRIDPNFADSYNNLGWVLRRQGNLEAALVAYQQAADRSPQNPIYQFNLGLIHEDLGKPEQAVDSYQQAIALDPAYVEAHNNLGYTYLLLGDLDKASEVLQTGLGLDPERPELHKNLGRVYLEQGDHTNAVLELKEAIALFNDYVEAYYYLTLAYQQLGEDKNACDSLFEFFFLAQADELDDYPDDVFSELQCNQ
ncbi:MAG: tetratricopeptide repeat protein [Chloroflexota bacterium]